MQHFRQCDMGKDSGPPLSPLAGAGGRRRGCPRAARAPPGDPQWAAAAADNLTARRRVPSSPALPLNPKSLPPPSGVFAPKPHFVVLPPALEMGFLLRAGVPSAVQHFYKRDMAKDRAPPLSPACRCRRPATRLPRAARGRGSVAVAAASHRGAVARTTRCASAY